MMQNERKTSASVSRRGFLKRSAAAASLAATAGLAISRTAHAAGSDVIKIGTVGCGGRCTGAADNAMSADPGTRLVAMTDLFPDRVQTSRNNLKSRKPDQVAVDDAHCFHGLDGYKGVIDSADVVLIACAAKFHPMYLKAGIDAGKHVFVEKPHGIDPGGIKVVTQATELAKQKKLGILSGLQSRFHPSIRETIQRVHDGQIGQIVAIEENSGCRDDAGERPYDADACRRLDDPDGESWFLGEPDYDPLTQASQVQDLMQSTGFREDPPGSGNLIESKKVGLTEIDRMNWLVEQCVAGEC